MKSDESHIKKILQQIQKKSPLSNGLEAEKIKTLYEEIMGKMIAHHTRKLLFKDGILTLHCDSAPLKHELFLGREKLRLRINDACGEELVKSIRIL